MFVVLPDRPCPLFLLLSVKRNHGIVILLFVNGCRPPHVPAPRRGTDTMASPATRYPLNEEGACGTIRTGTKDANPPLRSESAVVSRKEPLSPNQPAQEPERRSSTSNVTDAADSQSRSSTCSRLGGQSDSGTSSAVVKRKRSLSPEPKRRSSMSKTADSQSRPSIFSRLGGQSDSSARTSAVQSEDSSGLGSLSKKRR